MGSQPGGRTRSLVRSHMILLISDHWLGLGDPPNVMRRASR